jgi:DNA-binding CsgD family transcriptional regulator
VGTGELGGTLSPREREVVRLLASGYGTKQIAVELRISRNTVRTHIRNAMGKTDAHTSAQLVAIALTNGLIVPCGSFERCEVTRSLRRPGRISR